MARFRIKAGSATYRPVSLFPCRSAKVRLRFDQAAGADRTFCARPRKLLEPLSVLALLQLPRKRRSLAEGNSSIAPASLLTLSLFSCAHRPVQPLNRAKSLLLKKSNHGLR